MNYYFFWVPVGLYLIGWVLEFIRFLRANEAAPHWGGGMMAVGWGAHTIFLISRLLEQGFSVPNLLSGAAWLSIIVYYLIVRKSRRAVFSFVFPPFSVALLLVSAMDSADSLLLPEQITSPALAQNILIVHIIAVLAGLLLFALGCLFSIGDLYQEHRIKAKMRELTDSRLPSLGSLEHLNYRAIILGFFFLSVGILLGMMVSGLYQVPARSISWRQIVPALTWLVYAVFLLEHSLQGRRGRFGALWSIAGFIIVTTALIFELYIVASRS